MYPYLPISPKLIRGRPSLASSVLFDAHNHPGGAHPYCCLNSAGKDVQWLTTFPNSHTPNKWQCWDSSQACPTLGSTLLLHPTRLSMPTAEARNNKVSQGRTASGYCVPLGLARLMLPWKPVPIHTFSSQCNVFDIWFTCGPSPLDQRPCVPHGMGFVLGLCVCVCVCVCVSILLSWHKKRV